MTTKNAKDMTPDEWRKAREAIQSRHAIDQRKRTEAAALKKLETKYPKLGGSK